MYTIVLVFISVISFILALLIRVFKCYWLIAGYNTAPQNVKETFNIAGLSKFIGNILFGISAVLLLAGILPYFNQNVISYVLLVLLVPVFVYMPFRAQKFCPGSFETYIDTKLLKIAIIAVVSFAILICVIVFSVIFYGTIEPKISITNNDVNISGLYATKINLDKVNDIYLSDKMPSIKDRTNGLDFMDILKGHFLLSDNGKAELFIYHKSTAFIILLKLITPLLSAIKITIKQKNYTKNY
jgi:hypothetical protein